MKNLLLILFLLSCATIFAQKQVFDKNKSATLSGYVLDSNSKQPLQKVVIRLDYKKTGTLTDSAGFYTIDLPYGEYSITFSSVGYRNYASKLIIDAPSVTFSHALQNISKELEEVIVSAKGSSQQNIDRPLMGVNSLSIKTLKKIPAFLGEVDVLKGLQMLPGVTSVGEASNGVNIRGGTTDQNLILLDDIPIFNPTHLFGLFSVFPPDAINSVDLYKGGIPARYSGRVASVLDVNMTLPNLEKFTMVGGVSLVSNRLTIDIPLITSKLGIILAARGSYNDFLFKLGPAKLQNISANFGDLSAKLFYRVNQKNTITLSSYLSTDFFQTDLLGSIANINASSTQYDYKTVGSTFNWFHSFSSKLNLQTVATYSYFAPKTLLPEVASDNKVSLSSDITYKNAKLNLNYNPNSKQKIEVGVSATNYVLSPGTLDPGNGKSVNPAIVPKENSLELGIFADDEITLSPKLSFLIGLRYAQFRALGAATVKKYRPNESKDIYSVIDSTVYGAGDVIQTYGGFEPRFSMKYSLTENASLKFGYNRMQQFIQVISNTTTPLPTSRWKTSDNYIKPQVSSMFSGGFFKNFRDNIFEVSLEGYYRATDNILDYKPGADFVLQPYLETQVLQGKNRSYGIEVMLSKKKGVISGWASYTYSRSENQVNEASNFRDQINGGNWYLANYDRPHSFNATINISPAPIHTFSFNFSLSSGRPFTSPTGYVKYQGQLFPFYDSRNNDRISDYHRLDFSWTIDNPQQYLNANKRWKGSWVFTIYNLYGRSNAYSVYYRSENNIVKPYQLTIFNSIFPSLTYNFKFK
jgi:TonB dependent receptor/CarboxypepD_reg-like domain/TonB-dependent Receptor Plug Domain